MHTKTITLFDIMKLTNKVMVPELCWAIIGTPAKRHLNIQMAFRWRANGAPLKVVFGSSLPSSTKKNVVKVGPPLTKLSGSAHVIKVRKTAKIGINYNQVPHLTQCTTWESHKITIKHHKQEPRGQPFPSRWPQGMFVLHFSSIKRERNIY